MTMTDTALTEVQHAVQRKLGRCLLRLQQYERLLKALIAHADVTGSPDQLPSVQKAQLEKIQVKTLGTLVGEMTESVITQIQTDAFSEAENEFESTEQVLFRIRFQIPLSVENYAEVKADLRELVDLRNQLVHHFLENFDVWTSDGCTLADAYLDQSYETIDGHFLTLATWAQVMQKGREELAAFVQTQTFKEMLTNGIYPDGTIDWRVSGIARGLQEAEAVLAVSGWVLLDKAIEWMRQNHPDQIPRRYRCGSWRHVMHESQLFEIQKQVDVTTGRTLISYRTKL